MQKLFHVSILMFALMFLFSDFSFGQSNTSDCITGDHEKDFEYSIHYTQMKSGFIGLTQTTSFELGIFEFLYYKPGFSANYSPIQNASSIEISQQLFLLCYSLGFSVGRAQNFNLGVGSFYFKPEIILDLYYSKLSYSYVLNFRNNVLSGLNSGHNLTISIPIFSSCGFMEFKDSKKYHFGHAKNYFGNTLR